MMLAYPPAPTPAMPLLTTSIQNIPNSSLPLAPALIAIPTTRIRVVKIAPLFLPSRSEKYPNPNMPIIMPIINAFDRREYIPVDKSGYKTPNIRERFPIIDELNPSDPMARAEKMTMSVVESFE